MDDSQGRKDREEAENKIGRQKKWQKYKRGKAEKINSGVQRNKEDVLRLLPASYE